MTDEKGGFCLDNIKEGKYILFANCIGYTNRFLDFEMLDRDYELPTVILEGNNVTLDGVTIIGSLFIQKKDRLLIIPSKLQSKYAYNGYDLLYNLMIPGVVVNRKEGAVITSRGSATLYINGVKADFHEIQNLRPKDIDKEFALQQEKYMIEDKNTKHRNKPNRMSDAEVIVIFILFHSGGFRCFKHYYKEYICKHLKYLFPRQVSYNHFVELEKEVLLPQFSSRKSC